MARNPVAQFDVFVNYRRADTRADAGRLYDRLSDYFGRDHVFMDIDDIDAGQDFTQVLRASLDHCSAVLVVIGPAWLTSLDKHGRRRLDATDDFVRAEIAQALQRQLVVVPVLVGGATMPPLAELPENIKHLAAQQAVVISDRSFHDDVDALIDDLQTGSSELEQKPKQLRPLFLALIVLAIIVVVVPVTKCVQSSKDQRATEELAQVRAQTGRQLIALDKPGEAADAFRLAREINPENIPIQRELIMAMRLALEKTAFGDPRSSIDIGLRPDFQRFSPVTSKDARTALEAIGALRIYQPLLEDDVDLLLEEAFILKCTGENATQAIAVLQRVISLAPTNDRALAELGLLRTMLLNDAEGVGLVRQAIKIQPEEPRYHFYLARGLGTQYGCERSVDTDVRLDVADGCADALREYRIAAELATGNNTGRLAEQIHKRSVTGAFDIFHHYAKLKNEIPLNSISMSIAERIETLEYLIPKEFNKGRSGYADFPQYWLARLYRANGDFARSASMIGELIESESEAPTLWLELYAGVLEDNDDDKDEIAKVRARILLNESLRH